MTEIAHRSNIAQFNRRVRWARVMSGATIAGIVFGVAGTIWIWTDQHLVRTMVAPYVGLTEHPITVTPGIQLIGIALSIPPLILLVYLLLQARAVFSGFADGLAINDLAATRVWRIGMILVAKGLFVPFWRAAAGIIITIGNPPGQKALAVTIGLDDMIWIILGALLVAIGWTLREAARIAEENASFV